MPVSWEELESLEAANGFHLSDVLKRIGEPDPWADYEAARVALGKDVVDALSG